MESGKIKWEPGNTNLRVGTEPCYIKRNARL